MAKSKYEYVKAFEQVDRLLPSTWIVVRIDGQKFHRFSDEHSFEKPNDLAALRLMNVAAASCMKAFSDIVLSYGQSDEYSFVLRPSTELYQRRRCKLVSSITSQFTAAYQFHWRTVMPTERTLLYPPTFDGRAVMYPTSAILRDYLSWRQADCHINNLYNTTFWHLVLKGGLSNTAAEKALVGTTSGDKNEILFSRFSVNYARLPEIYRKGTLLYRLDKPGPSALTNTTLELSASGFEGLTEEHVDIIGDSFWALRPHLLQDN